MEYPIFDTHAHYDDAKFDPDRDEVLSALPAEKLGPRLGLSAEDFMQEEI